jgi:hypothetical protein
MITLFICVGLLAVCALVLAICNHKLYKQVVDSQIELAWARTNLEAISDEPIDYGFFKANNAYSVYALHEGGFKVRIKDFTTDDESYNKLLAEELLDTLKSKA